MKDEEFRIFMSNYPTGVTVVSLNVNGKPYGLTVNSFTSLSLDPLLILICIKKGKKSHDYISNSKYFAINILNYKQEEISKRFADPTIEDKRFEGIEFFLHETGCPLIKDCIGYIICENYKNYEGGDHTIFIGRVLQVIKGKEEYPLIYYKRSYTTVK